MSKLRCSREHLNEYENAINQYLQSKNIKDLTKYEITFKDGELHYLKWEYENIEKPNNIKAEPIVKRYINLQARLLKLNIPFETEGAIYFYDSNGKLINNDDSTKFVEPIHSIIKMFKNTIDGWREIYTRVIYINDGVLVVNNLKMETKVTGQLNIIIFCEIYNDVNVIRPTASTKFYMIPESFKSS